MRKIPDGNICLINGGFALLCADLRSERNVVLQDVSHLDCLI